MNVPPDLEPLLDDLEHAEGARAIVLGGSRAEGMADAGSDGASVGDSPSSTREAAPGAQTAWARWDAAKAVIEDAHARLCEQRRWVLNEKRIVARAGLGDVDGAFASVPSEPAALVEWVDSVAALLDRPSS